ncbi:MAG TPA: 2-amino-4-oxopentanoate thiolase subunit OrtA [Bacillota bacterium]|nr:2-amino-4-oxopentanoate thiolase subunit OrtA [Bacillota bacterium]
MIKKGSWVQIKKIILNPEQRANNLPEATKKVPLLLWVKGTLLSDSEMNDMVEIKTVTGRIESGELIDVNPSYLHNYGKYMPEIQEIDRIVKSTLFGGDYYE